MTNPTGFDPDTNLPAPGCGVGRSTTLKFPPGLLIRTAFMANLFLTDLFNYGLRKTKRNGAARVPATERAAGNCYGSTGLDDGCNRNSGGIGIHYSTRGMACSIRARVVSRPSTSKVSNKGGAFLRPHTATRIG